MLGVDVLIAERCLNHSLGGLVAVYDKHDYLTECRRALELWAAKRRTRWRKPRANRNLPPHPGARRQGRRLLLSACTL